MKEPLLFVKDLHAWYGDSHILQGVSLSVWKGGASVILGRNGAGKTTALKTIMGLVQRHSGLVRLETLRLDELPAYRVARAGVAYVPETRGVFPSLTVQENLTVSARTTQGDWSMERVFDTFPRLAERRGHKGKWLSGGEQQMLAIARALMTNGRLLMLDEPTEGLAPNIVEELNNLLRDLLDDGLSLLLVEQNFEFATNLSNEIYVLGKGRVQWSGSASDLIESGDVTSTWLGV
jgi:branched-chain amino acid transport system ATP-binding protein